MQTMLRRRFWVEAFSGILGGILGLITVVWPDWIELLSDWDPDQHDASVDWMVAGGFLAFAAAMAIMATIELRTVRNPA